MFMVEQYIYKQFTYKKENIYMNNNTKVIIKKYQICLNYIFMSMKIFTEHIKK